MESCEKKCKRHLPSLLFCKRNILSHCLNVQVEFFQDDVFPDTKVTWEPALSATDWFSGDLKAVVTIIYRLTSIFVFKLCLL